MMKNTLKQMAFAGTLAIAALTMVAPSTALTTFANDGGISVSQNINSSGNTYRVQGTKNFLALRSRKSDSDSCIIGKLYNGDTFTLLESGGKYDKIKCSQGVGYVKSGYSVYEGGSQEKTTGNTYRVQGTKNFLALRSKKSDSDNCIIGKLYNGDTFTLLESGGKYDKIKCSQGVGYVKTGYSVYIG